MIRLIHYLLSLEVDGHLLVVVIYPTLIAQPSISLVYSDVLIGFVPVRRGVICRWGGGCGCRCVVRCGILGGRMGVI